MGENDMDDVRGVAELLISGTRPTTQRGDGTGVTPMDIIRAHSINLITEDFISGYMQDGRMSVVRRFFCLFVTFDLIFVSLLWFICVMVNGDNIFHAFQKQILHYSIYTSLFDVVAAAICRFLILILSYALLYINHWLVIALSTSLSCLFLISKVFVFDWVDSKEQVFEVILIITSFLLAWGEAWFFDCRVIPQEQYARGYFSAITRTDHSNLMAPFLTYSQNNRRPMDSVADFYSPLDSTHNSDEEDEQDEEYRQMGLDCIRKAYNIFESKDWKVEKVTSKGDTIYYTQREKIGKIFKLIGRIKYPAKSLMEDLFYKIEDVPKWNPSILESRIIRKINSYTDITYQASVGAGGGMIRSRDFVNLRCWQVLRNGKIIDNDENSSSDDEDLMNASCEGSVSTVSDAGSSCTPQVGSVGSWTDTQTALNSISGSSMQWANAGQTAFHTLSKSLGARDFGTVSHIDLEEPPPLEIMGNKKDCKDACKTEETVKRMNESEKVWLSAAISIEHPKVPEITKYIRAENIVSGFALRPIHGKTDTCIFEWILCLDLKGYIPRYILDTAYTTFMSDYMIYLRKHVNELRKQKTFKDRSKK